MDWSDRLLIDWCVFRDAHTAVIVVCLHASRMLLFQVATAEWDPQLASHTDGSDPGKSHLFSLKVTLTFDWQLPVLRSRFTASREKHRPCLRCFSPLEPRSQSARQRPTQDLKKHYSMNFCHCFSSCLVHYKWKTCIKDTDTWLNWKAAYFIINEWMTNDCKRTSYSLVFRFHIYSYLKKSCGQ